MTNEIKNLINEFEVEGDFTHMPYDPVTISKAEEMLGYKFDSMYIAFLKEFGHGGIGGIEIMGLGKNNVLISANETMDYRKYGLPKNFLVIENCDEWVYCIDSKDGKIISWSKSKVVPAFDNFNEYLLDRFMDAAENLV